VAAPRLRAASPAICRARVLARALQQHPVMKRPFAPLLHAGVIVALVVGTNDAAYWTLYTMSRLQTAAETVLRDLFQLSGSFDEAGAPSAAFGLHAERTLDEDVVGRGGQ
jgi:hypothetical protein